MAGDRLPIGIQTFREIREGGLPYVDKTAYAGRLVAEGKHYFLSRPRRFGKSLFVDTLKDLFECRGELFEGLAVHGGWDWSTYHPVVRLDFSTGGFRSTDLLDRHIVESLAHIESQHGLEPISADDGSWRLKKLIWALHEHYGQRVVLLVDECDRPITTALERGDEEVAEANREYLQDLYAITKGCDAHLRFSFITGVTSFTRAGMFSGANNLYDLTLDPRYSAVCGYTEADLDRVFGDRLRGLDRNEVKEWYNGYSWLGDEQVYNPHCILELIDQREFGPWWYESGATKLLLNEIAKHDDQSIDFEGWIGGLEGLSAFDVGKIPLKTLMFQSGYLTLKEAEREGGRTEYRLDYPNREVRQAMSRLLLDEMAPVAAAAAPESELCGALRDGDAESLARLLHAFFAGMPHQWYAKEGVASSEGHYAACLRALFAGAKLDVRSEESTNRGRMDMAVMTDGGPYVFELKIADPANPGAALRQIHDRGYGEKYAGGGSPVRLVGIEFDPEKRNIGLFEMDPGDGGETASFKRQTPEERRRGRGVSM